MSDATEIFPAINVQITTFYLHLKHSVNDTLDDMLEDSGDEQETNGIVSRVLDEIGIEMSGKVFQIEIQFHGLRFLQPHFFAPPFSDGECSFSNK